MKCLLYSSLIRVYVLYDVIITDFDVIRAPRLLWRRQIATLPNPSKCMFPALLMISPALCIWNAFLRNFRRITNISPYYEYFVVLSPSTKLRNLPLSEDMFQQCTLSTALPMNIF